jgi:hypothetical protein
MTDLETAMNLIDTQLDQIMHPLMENGTITQIIFGVKTRRTPKTPFLRVVYGTATILDTNMGSTGQHETWIQPVKIGSTVEELENPQKGYRHARTIISQARNLLLTNRQLNLPEIVRKVDSSELVTVPFPFGNKNTLYGAGTTLNIIFMINNQK